MYLEVDKIKEFVAGRISFKELTNNIEDPYEVELICKDIKYKVSFDEIKQALKYFVDVRANYETVCGDWFENLYWSLGDMISLPAMIGEQGNCIELLDLGGAWGKFFFKNDNDLANWVISRLDDMDDEQWNYEDHPEHCTESLEDILQIIENYEINKTKSHTEWIFTHQQKKDFTRVYADEKNLAEQDDVIKKFYKEFLLELAEEGDITAIKDLGYAYYGDENPVFECDWEKSRDLMIKLMEQVFTKIWKNRMNII